MGLSPICRFPQPRVSSLQTVGLALALVFIGRWRGRRRQVRVRMAGVPAFGVLLGRGEHRAATAVLNPRIGLCRLRPSLALLPLLGVMLQRHLFGALRTVPELSAGSTPNARLRYSMAGTIGSGR